VGFPSTPRSRGWYVGAEASVHPGRWLRARARLCWRYALARRTSPHTISAAAAQGKNLWLIKPPGGWGPCSRRLRLSVEGTPRLQPHPSLHRRFTQRRHPLVNPGARRRLEPQIALVKWLTRGTRPRRSNPAHIFMWHLFARIYALLAGRGWEPRMRKVILAGAARSSRRLRFGTGGCDHLRHPDGNAPYLSRYWRHSHILNGPWIPARDTESLRRSSSRRALRPRSSSRVGGHLRLVL